MSRPPQDLGTRLSRLYAVHEETGCWLWTGRTTVAGYGKMNISANGRWRTLSAHRVSYEYHVGPIPDGLHIDHLCRTRACVNPEHMEPVTRLENMQRSHLARGHRVNA